MNAKDFVLDVIPGRLESTSPEYPPKVFPVFLHLFSGCHGFGTGFGLPFVCWWGTLGGWRPCSKAR